MKTFFDRLAALAKEAESHIQKFMKGKQEFRFVTEAAEDELEFDNTVGIAFHNKHGFDDYAHVTKIFRDSTYADMLYLEGRGYESGATLNMALSEAEYGDCIFIADLCK